MFYLIVFPIGTWDGKYSWRNKSCRKLQSNINNNHLLSKLHDVSMFVSHNAYTIFWWFSETPKHSKYSTCQNFRLAKPFYTIYPSGNVLSLLFKFFTSEARTGELFLPGTGSLFLCENDAVDSKPGVPPQGGANDSSDSSRRIFFLPDAWSSDHTLNPHNVDEVAGRGENVVWLIKWSYAEVTHCALLNCNNLPRSPCALLRRSLCSCVQNRKHS